MYALPRKNGGGRIAGKPKACRGRAIALLRHFPPAVSCLYCPSPFAINVFSRRSGSLSSSRRESKSADPNFSLFRERERRTEREDGVREKEGGEGEGGEEFVWNRDAISRLPIKVRPRYTRTRKFMAVRKFVYAYFNAPPRQTRYSFFIYLSPSLPFCRIYAEKKSPASRYNSSLLCYHRYLFGYYPRKNR